MQLFEQHKHQRAHIQPENMLRKTDLAEEIVHENADVST